MKLSNRRRNHQKILKPQFFESYRKERDNKSLLDVAAGYTAKKAVAACNAAFDNPGGNIDTHRRAGETEGEGQDSWGGVASKGVLAMELVPMMVKIQGLTNRASWYRLSNVQTFS